MTASCSQRPRHVSHERRPGSSLPRRSLRSPSLIFCPNGFRNGPASLASLRPRLASSRVDVRHAPERTSRRAVAIHPVTIQARLNELIRGIADLLLVLLLRGLENDSCDLAKPLSVLPEISPH